MTDHAVIARRSFLAGALAALGLRGPAAAQEPAESAAKASAQEAPGQWRHALTLLGEPKYGPDFPHFEYADPKAPVGGLVRLGAQGGFDNLNMIVNGLKGDLEGGITQIYDTLMEDSGDEPFSSYGQLAEAVRIAPDGMSVTYRLRSGARWHDGKPLTVEDVIWSFDTLKANSPFYAAYYHSVTKAEATGEREVTFRFSEAGNRELPQVLGQMQVLPKHWWTGTDANGKPRSASETTLEIPLGSGPYRLSKIDAGRYAIYERVADYWGKDLPVNRGRNNFGTVRFEYFRDGSVLLEALKGDLYDFRTENIARNWATQYDDFPAVKEGRLIKEEFPGRGTGIMQAFVFNLRRDKFKDERVRRAFNLAMNFEEMNRQLFYGQYQRIDSYFFGSELACSGLPEGIERAILDGVKDKLPPKVFTEPYKNPVNDTPEAVRANLRQAVGLLKEAGYELKGGQMVSKASGEPLTVEFLEFQNVFERVILPFAAQLKLIGIGSSVRVIDQAQYQNRLRAFDFDITTSNWPESLSPGNEQREYWGSASADKPGSRNIAGIKDAGIDALIEKLIFAGDRETLVAATRALDRALLSHNYVVPQWSSPVTRTIRWNRFSRPALLPKYGGSGFPTTWWYDEALASKTGAPR
ncbi:microcin C transport system substrate-binding protein [Methylorubrum rhodinum]|uniref:Microcin C transport system substrate-binding protein n=1 Tax=Methylorubrum rhodinum TaxID=29428 RepID=A0A840ZSE8_9HYPH|nr:extracellular solute-binding protein [Methylorubrum rhodinum]MBB5759757.1 microcin C transport system substrate-binding protein [Methylorubrum rhodinum]